MDNHKLAEADATDNKNESKGNNLTGFLEFSISGKAKSFGIESYERNITR